MLHTRQLAHAIVQRDEHGFHPLDRTGPIVAKLGLDEDDVRGIEAG